MKYKYRMYYEPLKESERAPGYEGRYVITRRGAGFWGCFTWWEFVTSANTPEEAMGRFKRKLRDTEQKSVFLKEWE